MVLLHFAGTVMNMVLQNDLFQRVINSSGLVINVTGVIIGVYDIYKGLMLRKESNIWMLLFVVGIICVGFNAYALSL